MVAPQRIQADPSSVERALQHWASQLVDISSKNPLLYFRHTKRRTLDLSVADPECVSNFMLQGRCSLRRLYPESNAFASASRRVTEIRRIIKSFQQEQGIAVGHLALDMATWQLPKANANRTARSPSAPIVLWNIEIESKGKADDSYELVLAEEGQLNPVLGYYLAEVFGVDVKDLIEPSGAEDRLRHLKSMVDTLLDRAGDVPGFEIVAANVVGLFSYAKLPMVYDLQQATALATSHPVVAALAGDEGARKDLVSREEPPAVQPDSVRPNDEFIVLPADSSQLTALHTVLAGMDVVIKGPPGTGKSQLIACLIVELAARGKRTLFVTEKRAAIDAVMDRLLLTGLAKLVLDLHDGVSNRKAVTDQLAASLEDARESVPPRNGTVHDDLWRIRGSLARYTSELHHRHSEWGVSFFEVINSMCGIGDVYMTELQFTAEELRAMNGVGRTRLRTMLEDFVADDGLYLGSDVSVWMSAKIDTDDEAQRLQQCLVQLRNTTVPRARQLFDVLVGETGLRRPRSVAQWKAVLDLLDEVERSIARFGPAAFGPDLDSLVSATAAWRCRTKHSPILGLRDRWRFRKQAKTTRPGTRRAEIHRDLIAAADQRDRWRQWAEKPGPPVPPSQLATAVDIYRVLTEQLNEISVAIATVSLSELTEDAVPEKLRSLQADEHTLRKLPKLRKIRRELLAVGLGSLLHELGRKSVSNPNEAVRYFDWAWLNSVRRELSNEYPSVGQFEPSRHERLVARFNELDHQHMALAAQRVRRLVAERLVNTMNAHPDQTATVRREAAKTRRQMGLRKLVGEAPDVLLAARPCWALSPLVVSQVLPAQRFFDVVIFDEASQVRPADAIASIMRGKHVVVAGDERQLPPTTFFDKMLRGEDEDEDDGSDEVQTTGMESVLAAITGIVPPHAIKPLRWHYRSEDERLITFSNRKIYKPHGEELITFPGTSLDDAVRHFFVDMLATAHTTDSSTAEIDRVVVEVREHARSYPDDSLGVITLNIGHAQRLRAAVDLAVSDDPDLAAYFARFPEGSRREFFVKHLEIVQGDERDAIIFSLGYARDPDGRFRARFGPLNHIGGERRLNVAVTRASRRLTVISSFGPEHFNPVSFRNDGPKLLWEFLHYAKRGGELPNVDDGLVDEENYFENQVAEFLSESGVPFHRQVGAGRYRIDFALIHPDRPGQRLLAVETDGDSYHGAASVRDRDRLRQAHLERLGWRFHRIWSSAWFARSNEEKEKLIAAWKEAVEAVDKSRNDRVQSGPVHRLKPSVRPQRTGPRPTFTPNQPIRLYSRDFLAQLVLWITSDGMLRTDEEIIKEAAREELGYSRVSSQTRSALEVAIQDARRMQST